MRIDPDEALTSFCSRLLDEAAFCTPDFALPTYAIIAPMTALRGMHAPGLAATFEDDIREAGKWEGRGHAVTIDAAARYRDSYQLAIRDLAKSERESDIAARRDVAALLVHELAHALASPYTGKEDSIGGQLSRTVFFQVADDADNAKSTALCGAAPWQKHDARFLRAALHLTNRMRKRVPELRIAYADVVFAEAYGLSPIDRYAVALLDEFPSQDPIRCLLPTQAPDEFRALWRADVKRWYQQTAMGEKETRLAEQGLKACA